jgi:hypothetical protein
MVDRRLSDGARAIRHLEQDVDERATFEGLVLEPLVEDVEDGEELVLGCLRAPLHLTLEPVLRPALLPHPQELDDELLLRREVAIERALRDARVLQDRVDPDRLQAVAGEEVVRRFQDSVAHSECPGRSDRSARVVHDVPFQSVAAMIQACLPDCASARA